MNWKRYFTSTILWRGEEYFKQGRVKGLTHNKSSCMARVFGTRIYNVRITGLDSGILRMSCTCNYASDGFRCKHMAAVLYEWESLANGVQKKTTVSEQRIRVYPFTGKPDDGNAVPYFEMGRMTENLTFYQDTVLTAENLIKDGIIRLQNVAFRYPSEFENTGMSGTANGLWMVDGILKPVRVSFDREQVRDMTCDICYHNYYAGYHYGRDQSVCCIHTTAVLLLLSEYIRLYDPGDATSASAASFLRSFGKQQAAAQIEENRERKAEISLKPKVIREYEGFYLSFRTGSSRLYVIKDLTAYVQTAESYGTMTFGKTGAVDFRTQAFTDEGARWFELLARKVHEQEALYEQMRKNRRYYGEDLRVSGQLALSGDILDAFYELARGQNIDYQDKYTDDTAGVLNVRNNTIRVPLRIEPLKKESGGGLLVTGTFPQFLHGSRNEYYMQDHSLSRLAQEQYQLLKPLLDVSGEGTLRMEIGRKHMAEFYYRVLPVLRENPCLEISGDADPEVVGSMPPEAVFSFYLDLEDGRIILKGEVAYEEKKHPLKVPEMADLPLEPYRDRIREMQTAEKVEELFPSYDRESFTFASPKTDDAIYRILAGGVQELMTMGEVHGSDAFFRLRIRPVPKVTVGVSVESEIMNLDIRTHDLTDQELLELLDSYRRKKKWHRLSSGDFVALDEGETLESLSDMMDSLGVSPREFTEGHLNAPLYRALYLDRMLEEHDELVSNRDRTVRKLVKNFKTVNEADYEVPESLCGTLRNYQYYGYKWIRTLADAGFGGILADDMGLGKTLQMIAVFLAEKEEGKEGTSLVVCPASLVYNWQEEIRRFAPSLAVRTVTGNLSERRAILEESDTADVLITSYDLLKRDAALYDDKLFLTMVVDEAQYIKNPKAAVSKSVKVIRARKKMALTGTPIENRLSELWSIFDFLMPGFLYGYERFRTELEIPVAKDKDEAATARLKKMVGPFILRRLKGDVLKDLPEKLEEVRYAGFEEEQRKLYDAQVVHMRELLNSMENAREGRMKILAELTKIRQICCDPLLLLDNYEGESAKRTACMELIESAVDGGHRMLVFSQFTSMLELLEKELKERNISYYKITGSVPKEERLRMVHAYNADEVPVFLISLKAGGTGLNLTGADVVIHYDPWWNLAAQNQATDRAHRIGQTKAVSVYRLIVKDTIEEKILLMQEAKKDLADAVLSGESESLTALTKEELLELLS